MNKVLNIKYSVLYFLKKSCIIEKKLTLGKVKYTKGKAKKTSISLSPYYQEIIKREMETGKYNSIAQLICYALLQVEKDSLIIERVKKRADKLKKN